MKGIGLGLALFIFLSFPVFADADHGTDRSWEGKLTLSPVLSLRIVFNVAATGDTVKSVTMDSPDQGAYGIPMTVNSADNGVLSVSYPQLSLSFTGKMYGDAIIGQFSQGPLKVPLMLTPKAPSARPQTPQAPFPYINEEVTFSSALDSASLFGTLTVPSDYNMDTPVAVLLSGSGLQNRDEEIFGHKPFAVIADWLARNGISSLRYDDRGVDKSTGLRPNEDTYQNALDAKGAVEFLRDRGFRHIGLIGHSEGGLIADILSAEDDSLTFVVEIGSPAVPGDSILLFQNEFLLRDGNMPEDFISMYIEAMRGMFDSQKNVDRISFDKSKYEIFSEKWKENPVLAPLIKDLDDHISYLSPWLKFFINYDPLPDLRRISVPLLMIYGDNDTQVPPSLNVPVINDHVTNAQVNIYPQLNHLMQHSITGKVTEYADIEETFSPEVLHDISNFILSTVKE